MNHDFLLHCNLLSQQYAIDQVAKVQDHDISYINRIQEKFRTTDYKTYRDAEESMTTDDVGKEVPKSTFLPSSFRFGERHMRERFRDIMALCKKLGNPSLFLTMTANPNWREIVEECQRSGETPSMRPDIVSRVFNIKLKQLEEELFQNGLFGKCIGHVRVIEFQKVSLRSSVDGALDLFSTKMSSNNCRVVARFAPRSYSHLATGRGHPSSRYSPVHFCGNSRCPFGSRASRCRD
jgi:Helitron helicase-like domain at N-terminus